MVLLTNYSFIVYIIISISIKLLLPTSQQQEQDVYHHRVQQVMIEQYVAENNKLWAEYEAYKTLIELHSVRVTGPNGKPIYAVSGFHELDGAVGLVESSSLSFSNAANLPQCTIEELNQIELHLGKDVKYEMMRDVAKLTGIPVPGRPGLFFHYLPLEKNKVTVQDGVLRIGFDQEIEGYRDDPPPHPIRRGEDGWILYDKRPRPDLRAPIRGKSAILRVRLEPPPPRTMTNPMDVELPLDPQKLGYNDDVSPVAYFVSFYFSPGNRSDNLRAAAEWVATRREEKRAAEMAGWRAVNAQAQGGGEGEEEDSNADEDEKEEEAAVAASEAANWIRRSPERGKSVSVVACCFQSVEVLQR